MVSLALRSRRLLGMALVGAVVTWALGGSRTRADDAEPVDTGHAAQLNSTAYHKHQEGYFGTLSYGPPGVFPGFQGFGLAFHPGYGYGGAGLGVGAEGGYPFYGGPGYIHPGPALQRLHHELPFLHYGGAGEPFTYGEPGRLVATEHVAIIGNGHEFGYTGNFGTFTGAFPYPESLFAPYTVAAARGAMGGTGAAPSGGGATRVGVLGINVEPVAEPPGQQGLRLTKVEPGSLAENAGLKEGEVIRFANGYFTTVPGNLTWIIANAAPDKTLRVNVRSAAGAERMVTIALP
jgi:hypothetical protein